MRAPSEPFNNRVDAGKELAESLAKYKGRDCIVLAIPRGGVVVGYEVALALDLPMDVIVPRKIPAPFQRELAIGAVASWGDHDRILDDRTIRVLGITSEYIDQEVERQLTEVARRLMAYRGTCSAPDIAEREVILVDDGIATGYTTRAAAVAVRHLNASSVILAVPVGPPDSIDALSPYVDDIICLETPTPFMAVGYWYKDFAQTSDEEVVELLKKARCRGEK